MRLRRSTALSWTKEYCTARYSTVLSFLFDQWEWLRICLEALDGWCSVPCASSCRRLCCCTAPFWILARRSACWQTCAQGVSEGRTPVLPTPGARLPTVGVRVSTPWVFNVVLYITPFCWNCISILYCIELHYSAMLSLNSWCP